MPYARARVKPKNRIKWAAVLPYLVGAAGLIVAVVALVLTVPSNVSLHARVAQLTQQLASTKVPDVKAAPTVSAPPAGGSNAWVPSVQAGFPQVCAIDLDDAKGKPKVYFFLCSTTRP
jgi:hypothetical protein